MGGQDLKGLKAFMERRGIRQIYLSYFGLDDPRRYGIDYVWLPSYELPNPNRAPLAGSRSPETRPGPN